MLWLIFDSIVFLIVLAVSIRSMRQMALGGIMKVVLKDGILYFFVLFTSNLAFLIMLFCAPVRYASLLLQAPLC